MARSASVPPETSRHGTPRYVAQRYRLDTPIGRGGAGVVWCGEDELLQRPVAIKEIMVPMAGAQAERDAIRARVLREARALARLHSPAIVSVFDVVEEHERHWIVMELVDADSLGDTIKNHGPLPFDQVAAIGLALADALAAAHSAGVLHRDVKPGNVLLGRDNRVRLTDFGIAATEGDVTLTGTGALVGSPAYIAPERVRGSSGSPASDLWGLGATLYSAVEGCPPFEGPETYAVLSAVVEGRRRPFRLAGPLRGLLTDLLDRPAELRPDVDEIRRRLTPIARNATPVPAVVTNPRSHQSESDADDSPSDDGLENLAPPRSVPRTDQQPAPIIDVGVTDRLVPGRETTPVPPGADQPVPDDDLTAVGHSPIIDPRAAHTGPSGQHTSPSGQHAGLSGQHTSPSGQHAGLSGQHAGPSGPADQHDDVTQIGALTAAADLFDQDDANMAAGLLSLDRDGERAGRGPASHRAPVTGRGDATRGPAHGGRRPTIAIIAGAAVAALAGLAVALTLVFTGGGDGSDGTSAEGPSPSPSFAPQTPDPLPTADVVVTEPVRTPDRPAYTRPATRRTTTPAPPPPPEQTDPPEATPTAGPTTPPVTTAPATSIPATTVPPDPLPTGGGPTPSADPTTTG